MLKFLVIFLVVLTISLPISGQGLVSTDRPGAVELVGPSLESSYLSFGVMGDAGADHEGRSELLGKAISQLNLLQPDLVVHAGAVFPAGSDVSQWQANAREYKQQIASLAMSCMPVAGGGNYASWITAAGGADIWQRAYEENIGPLWYSFPYKKYCFIMLYSQSTGELLLSQKQFLLETLADSADSLGVFVFLDRPCWQDEAATCEFWTEVGPVLESAAKVRACFAGHNGGIGFMRSESGIEYYTLSATGSMLAVSGSRPAIGAMQHFLLVKASENGIDVTALELGSLLDPGQITAPLMLFEKSNWNVISESSRELNFPVTIPSIDPAGGTLQIFLAGAYDNSGDHGVQYYLYNSNYIEGEPLLSGFADKDDPLKLEYEVEAGQRLTFIIKDLDSDLTGIAP
ncbi:MAG: hypothetical protein JXM68_12690, partial [Sedimentisphaerales bacterium]|nr:hypothetical protein [Sedimentisphaerales bacterium]